MSDLTHLGRPLEQLSTEELIELHRQIRNSRRVVKAKTTKAIKRAAAPAPLDLRAEAARIKAELGIAADAQPTDDQMREIMARLEKLL